MPRELYNEGRVQGMSAYEVYVREHLSEDDTDPASEREWLAASLASGSSLLYKMHPVSVQSDDFIYNVKIPLPVGTRLSAANTITASFFDGEAQIDTDRWARKITSYGNLIVNNSVLVDTNKAQVHNVMWSDAKKAQLKDYMRIFDGVVLQPGTWVDTTDHNPAKDLKPSLSDAPFIQLQIRGPITTEFYILFTGFTIRTVLSGSCGLDGSTNTTSSADGDFLGPAVFPWANKIIFTMPTSYVSCLMNDNYTRTIYKRKNHSDDISDNETAKEVYTESVVDMATCDPSTYYGTGSEYQQPVRTSRFPDAGEGVSVLTTYQRNSAFPPALWGAKITSKDLTYLNPIDIVAPGSVKMFKSPDTEDKMKLYENTYPGTFSIMRNSDGTMSTLDEKGNLNPVASVTKELIKGPDDFPTESMRPTLLRIKTGSNETLALSLSGLNSSNQYEISMNPSVPVRPSSENITWYALLLALAGNGYIDLLGDRLKSAKRTLIRSEFPYLEFGTSDKPKRLYICANMPTDSDIPDGSIGIGWGFED